MTMTQNNKRSYEKPTMIIYEMQHKEQLLQSSVPIDPNPSPYQW